MKHRFFILSFFSFFSSYICCNNYHDSLILLHKPLLTFYDGDSIEVYKNKYQQVVNKWEQKLKKTWNNIFKDLHKNIAITPEQIDKLLENNTFVKLYMTSKSNEMQVLQNTLTPEDKMNSEVVAFIKRFIHQYSHKKNIKVILTPYVPSLTLACGSDSDTHYLACNSLLYSTENIRHYYDALTSSKGLFSINVIDSNTIQCIEISNLLLTGIMKAASHIQHQSNIFTYLISYLLYCNHIEEQETVRIVKRYMQYTESRSILEAIFQSKNPLEVALYGMHNHKPLSKEYKMLQELTHDIALCYSKKSLAKFKNILKELTSLYQDFC